MYRKSLEEVEFGRSRNTDERNLDVSVCGLDTISLLSLKGAVSK